MADGIETGRGTRAAYVHYDRVNGELRERKGARLAALTSGGAIPELGDFKVIAEPDETLIGSVNEDWATESMAGDVFILGTHHWQIRQVTGGEVRVVDAGDRHPTIPFWRGEAPARTVELSQEVTRIRSVVERAIGDDDLARAVDEIVELAGVERDAAATIVTYLAAGRAVLGVMPTQDDLVLERFFDESGGMQLVVHSPYGGRLNRALGTRCARSSAPGSTSNSKPARTTTPSSSPSDPTTASRSPTSPASSPPAPSGPPCNKRSSTSRSSKAAGAGTSTAASSSCGSAAGRRSHPTSSACRATTSSPPCSPAPRPAKRT